MNEEQLLAFFTKTIQEIFENVLKVEDILNDEHRMALLNSILEAMARLGIAVEDSLPIIIEQAFNSGMNEAAASINETVKNITATGATAATEAGVAATSAVVITAAEKKDILTTALKTPQTKVQKRIHNEALMSIVEDSMMDMKAALRTSAGSAMRVLPKAKEEIAKGMIQGQHNREITTKVQEQFLKEGMGCFVTSDGKKLPLDFYARTVTRTKIRTAHTEGALARYKMAGVNLVKIFNNGITCHKCAKYRDMVFCIDGEEDGFPTINVDDISYKKLNRLPPFHPNCYCTLKPFVKEFKTDEEMEEERERWRKFDPEKDNRTAEQKKAYEKEQKIRRETNDAKKMYYKMKRLFVEIDGDKDFPSLQQFFRAKRANSKKYQDLMKRYKDAQVMNREAKKASGTIKEV